MTLSSSTHTHTITINGKTYKTNASTHTHTEEVPPPPVLTPSQPITVTTDGVTISDKSFTGTGGGPGGVGAQGFGIHSAGTLAAPIHNLAIRRCTFSGWNVAINLEFTYGFTIEDCVIADVLYAGVLTFTATDGTIQRNQIRRIGYQTFPPSADTNAYGIALSRGGGDDLVAQPRSERITVDGNTIEDVPTWHGLDTHGGKDITWSNNIVRRCMRPIFLTGGAVIHPVNQTVTGNQILEAKSYPYGQSANGNLAAVTLNGMQGGNITGNAFSSTYGTPAIYDYTGGGNKSTWVDGGNTVVA